MDRLSRFIFSTPNLVGCGCLIVAALLHLMGLMGVHGGWLVLVSYAVGYAPFAFVSDAPLVPEAMRSMDTLTWVETHALPKMPPEARVLLADILDRLKALMPQLKEMEADGMVDASARAQFKGLVIRLLPETVTAYLKLPPVYARMTKLADGSTPQQHLVKQLLALQAHVIHLEGALMSPYVNQVLVNTRFLEEKVAVGAMSL